MVVGIATAKYASATIEGIGFAIPINDAVIIANQLKATGQVNGRPYLGVSVINASNRSENDADLIDGAFVASVFQTAPQQKPVFSNVTLLLLLMERTSRLHHS